MQGAQEGDSQEGLIRFQRLRGKEEGRGSLGVVASRAQCPAEGRRWVSGICHRSCGIAHASGACGIQLCTLTYG